MVSLELPDKLAYQTLTKELGNYRILYIKESNVYTLIRIEEMELDDEGKLNANLSQVELTEKDKEDIKVWFEDSDKLGDHEFYDIDLSSAPFEGEDSIRRLNVLLLRLYTIFDTSEFKVNKTYDTDIKIQ